MIKKKTKTNSRDNKDKLIISKSDDKIVFLLGKDVKIKAEGKGILGSFESYMEVTGKKIMANRLELLIEVTSWMKKAGFKITIQEPPEPSIWSRPLVKLLNFALELKEFD